MRVSDQTTPLITINGNAAIALAVGQSFVDPGAVAVDAVDGLIAVSVEGSVNAGVPGSYRLIRGGMLRIRFLKRSGVTYTVESSANLVDWTSGVLTMPSSEQPQDAPAGYTVYEAALPVHAGGSFKRVVVSESDGLPQ